VSCILIENFLLVVYFEFPSIFIQPISEHLNLRAETRWRVTADRNGSVKTFLLVFKRAEERFDIH
jgi:hypothetical protein